MARCCKEIFHKKSSPTARYPAELSSQGAQWWPMEMRNTTRPRRWSLQKGKYLVSLDLLLTVVTALTAPTVPFSLLAHLFLYTFAASLACRHSHFLAPYHSFLLFVPLPPFFTLPRPSRKLQPGAVATIKRDDLRDDFEYEWC